jgi:hypothetical protein
MEKTIANNPAIADAIIATGKAEGWAAKAHAAFYTTCERLHDLQVMSDDLKRGGRYYQMAYDLLSESRLTKAELATLRADGPMKAGTPKHRVANKIGAVMRNIRANLAKIEGVAAGKPKGEPAGFIDLCAKELQACYMRANKDRVGDEPAMIDHAAFISHLKAAADTLGRKLKDK